MSNDPLVALSRDRIERGSKSFAGAARLLAPETRASAYMLYAWCRYCDDEIDGQELGFAREAENGAEPAGTPAERLHRLQTMTREALDGRPATPEFQALAAVVARHAIPERHPFELLEGFRMDVEGHAYRTIDDTLLYGYHVAGVVGVMMAMIMGVRSPETLNRASDLGIAFQLTNIARDVVPDAQAGRVYLPHDWLAEAGVEPADVADPENRPNVYSVTERLLETADRYYDSAPFRHSRTRTPRRLGHRGGTQRLQRHRPRHTRTPRACLGPARDRQQITQADRRRIGRDRRSDDQACRS